MVVRKTMRMSWLRCVGCAAVLCCGRSVWAAPASASSTTKRSVARAAQTVSPWEAAERGRDALQAIPEGSRTKANYTTAMDGYRAVYHGAPQDVHAPAAVFAVAELLAEQGRALHDAKSLKAAIGQYEFLRVQYPGSSLRVAALLAQGQIYGNDLHDVASAKERYALLIQQFPGSAKADEARAGLATLSSGARGQGSGSRGQMAARGSALAAAPSAAVTASESGGASSLGAMPPTGVGTGEGLSARDAVRRGTAAPSDAEPETTTTATNLPATNLPAADAPVPGPSNVGMVARRPGTLAKVTGIRHWSTTTYTRVAIDLGDDVTFEAARVPNPDRIYFDLHGTKLARELAGKSFAVTDDGFLKKIRAAQFSDDMTRIVLDVNDVTEYSAFLLPNPYRLIIDIHGGRLGAGLREPSIASAKSGADGGAGGGAPVPAPVAAAVVKTAPGRPVPHTVSARGSSATEIAALSAQPGRVDATNVPTSKDKGAGGKVQGLESRSLAGDGAGEIAGDGAGSASGTTALAAAPAGKSTGKGKKSRIGVRETLREDSSPARAAVPTADGQTSLVRALGLKIGRIVIDAGHGGHDSGTIGVDGIEEKDVVLDVALRVGKMLHDRLGAEVVYTRSDDTFIPLETRTAIANKAQADLFLSIHANSSPDATARGVETYYLNFTSSPDALETAARENAVSDQSIHQLSDLVKKIALKDKIAESREFASDVEASLYGGLQRGNAGLKDRGVKKAPFVVLIGANMPSILAEISFVTNPKDASQLQQPEYRQRVAESLYKGVAKYAGGLSGVKGPTERASIK